MYFACIRPHCSGHGTKKFITQIVFARPGAVYLNDAIPLYEVDRVIKLDNSKLFVQHKDYVRTAEIPGVEVLRPSLCCYGLSSARWWHAMASLHKTFLCKMMAWNTNKGHLHGTCCNGGLQEGALVTVHRSQTLFTVDRSSVLMAPPVMRVLQRHARGDRSNLSHWLSVLSIHWSRYTGHGQ